MAIFLYNFSKIGLVRPGLACQARPGRARPCRAGPDKRPEYAEGSRIHENQPFIEKRCFRPILVISGPSRRQKWIRLEIMRWKMVWGRLEVKI